MLLNFKLLFHFKLCLFFSCCSWWLIHLKHYLYSELIPFAFCMGSCSHVYVTWQQYEWSDGFIFKFQVVEYAERKWNRASRKIFDAQEKVMSGYRHWNLCSWEPTCLGNSFQVWKGNSSLGGSCLISHLHELLNSRHNVDSA